MKINSSYYIKQIVVLLLASTAFSLTDIYAQIPIFRNYNVQDGLPSSETYCIAQDKDGYIIIGSDRGLAKFDGHKFETLTTSDGLLDNTIFRLNKINNQIWYYTYNSLIGSVAANRPYEYAYNHLLKKLNPKSIFTSVVLDKKGTLWLGKVQWSKFGNNTIHSITGITKEGDIDTSLKSPANNSYTNIYISDSGHCLVSGYYFMKHIKLYALDDRKLLLEFDSEAKHPHDVLGINRNGKVWLCINDIILIISDHKIIRKIPCSGSVLSMSVDHQENIWVGYRNKGVWVYPSINHYYKPTKWLEKYSISSMLNDNDGGMWFTTLENGIFYLPTNYLLSHNQSTGLHNDKVIKICQLHDQPIILTSDRKLQIYDTTRKIWEQLFPKEDIVSIVSNSNCAFFSTTLDQSNKLHRKKFQEIAGNKIIHVNKYAWNIHDGGIARFDTFGHLLKKYFLNNIPLVTSIQELPNDRVLLGTINGLYILEKSNSLAPIKLSSNQKMIRITSTTMINDDYSAIGTAGQGLYILGNKNNKIVNHISALNGLKSEICNIVYSDSNNNIWIGTNQGLGKISNALDSSTFACQWVDIHDGLISNEINDICRIKNDLWLATNSGITILPLTKDLNYTRNIPVILKRVMINGKPLNEKTSSLSHTENNISFTFTGLNHQYSDAIRYKYRLVDGKVNSWTFTETPIVNYNELRPGHYRFEYAAIAPRQSKNSAYSSFSFTINEPFWQTNWFIVIIIVTGTISIHWIVYLRIKAIKKRMHLAADLNRYRDKALREQMSPHFIYNSLNAIQSYILKNDQRNSVIFLNKFSRLMRYVFNNTVQDLVPLSKDLEALSLYAALENMRFPDQLRIIIPEILPDNLQYALVPPQLIQPFVENAILHGLLPKQGLGIVEVTIEKTIAGIRISVKDNGIGRIAANELKIRKLKYQQVNGDTELKRKHSGTTVTIDRIAQIWQREYDKNKFSVTDLYTEEGKPAGTLIQFYLPLIIHDKSNNNR